METGDKITEAGRVILIMRAKGVSQLSFPYLYNLTYAMGRREMTAALNNIVKSELQSAS